MSRTTFGKYEVESCKKVELSATGFMVETCEDGEAEFYGIYRRSKRGFAMHIADRDTRDEAEERAKTLNKNKKDKR